MLGQIERIALKDIHYQVIVNGKLPFRAGSSASLFSDNLEGWDGVRGGREVQEGGDMCIPGADSC